MSRDALDAFMEIAWRDFIMFAVHHDEFLKAYSTHRGSPFVMATAANEEIRAFVHWLTAHHFGIDLAPAAVREDMGLPPPAPCRGCGTATQELGGVCVDCHMAADGWDMRRETRH